MTTDDGDTGRLWNDGHKKCMHMAEDPRRLFFTELQLNLNKTV
jgi:hypothetical protein